MDGIKVIENADGKKYSSFLSGGKIKKLYLPENENEVVRAVEYLTEKNEKFFYSRQRHEHADIRRRRRKRDVS